MPAARRDNNRSEWAPLMSTYQQPPFIPANAAVALSFGLAGPGSGVPFHIHGAGYSETIFGRKRWCVPCRLRTAAQVTRRQCA
jgi:hypothetical protein